MSLRRLMAGMGGLKISYPSAFRPANTVLYLSSQAKQAMYKEAAPLGAWAYNQFVPLNHPSSDADTVGFLYDLGPNALFASAPADVNRLTLGSDGNRKTFFNIASGQCLDILNSEAIFKDFHKSNPVWGIAFWVKKSVDGTIQTILDNTNNTTVNAGLIITITALNKVKVSTFTAGATAINYTTTAGVTVANGWSYIVININGVGATNGSINVNGTTETFDVPATSSTADSTYPLRIGRQALGANSFAGSFDNLIIQNTVFTAGEITNFAAFNPTRNSGTFLTLARDYNFNITGKIWADNAKTIPITNGTAMAVVESNVPVNFGSNSKRDLIQTTAGNRPVWNSNIVNGFGAGSWNGAGQNLQFATPTERGGAFTIFMAVRNIDATFGSHILQSGLNSYWVLVGKNYRGTGLTDTVFHHDTVEIPALVLTGDSDDIWQVLSIAIDAGISSVMNKYGGINSASSILQFALNNMGIDAFPGNDWDLNGFVTRMLKYNGYMDYTTRLAKHVELKSLYAL